MCKVSLQQWPLAQTSLLLIFHSSVYMELCVRFRVMKKPKLRLEVMHTYHGYAHIPKQPRVSTFVNVEIIA